MNHKSAATKIHLDKARKLSAVVSQLDDMALDVISIDYDNKTIEITKPADDFRIANLAPVCGKNNTSIMIIRGFKVWWKNPKAIKEIRYVRA